MWERVSFRRVVLLEKIPLEGDREEGIGGPALNDELHATRTFRP